MTLLTREHKLEIYAFPYNLTIAVFPTGKKGYHLYQIARGPQDLGREFMRSRPFAKTRELAIQNVIDVLNDVKRMGELRFQNPDKETADFLKREEGRIRLNELLNTEIIDHIKRDLLTGRAAGTYLYPRPSRALTA